MSSRSCGVFEEVARGSLARVQTFAHGDDWEGDPDEELFDRPTAIFTTYGAWTIHGRHERVAADEGLVVLGHRDESYGCSHPAGPIDRTFCVTFLGDHELPDYGCLPRRLPLDVIVRALRHCDSPLRVDALALTLLAELHELPHRAASIDPRRRKLVARAQEHLAENLHRELTLTDLARAVHASPFHLHRVFSAVTGTTPHAYLTELRVNRACELLREGWSVGETALAVGFRSRGHLARVFRARTGVHPSQYA